MNASFQDRLISLVAGSQPQWKTELARHCGVSYATVVRWLTDRHSSDGTQHLHLHQIAAYFDVPARWLATGNGPERVRARRTH
ncbi:helix-turn-helix domain-containing protein [Acidovorax cavernicola]|uniref:XRE family transcriptional regulator n=1 Tax=Acidovorax cavernicola TaxID=1675792 RepID=A0A9X8D9M9_9BURK|nr:helix-turn-helix transcriptional regulator [Acidovorax cavernicola]RIX85416.1 XRE family transcriptional regulator [Acidovorax cavernicola]